MNKTKKKVFKHVFFYNFAKTRRYRTHRTRVTDIRPAPTK